MPTFEVLFKVGDSNPTSHSQKKNWEDGQIIAVQEPGLFFPKSELNVWVSTGTPPTGFNTLEENHRNELDRLRLRFRRYQHPNFTRAWHIEKRFGVLEADQAAHPDIADMDVECAAQEAALDAQLANVNIASGLDTNWGVKDLQVHGAVRITLTEGQASKSFGSPTDTTYDVFAPRQAWCRALYRIKYEAFLSAPEIADLQNANTYVPLDRVSVPLTPAVAVEKITRTTPSGPGSGEDP